LRQFKRGEAPLSFPPPPLSREGDKGGGLPCKKLKGIGFLVKTRKRIEIKPQRGQK